MEEAGALVAPPPAGSENTFQGSFPRGLSVLVVDDDALCLKLVERMLITSGYGGASSPPLPLPLAPAPLLPARQSLRARLPFNARLALDRPLYRPCAC